MGNQTSQIVQTACLAAVISGMAGAPLAKAHSNSVSPTIDNGTLTQVESLYGLTKDQAIERLAKEQDAAVQERLIKSLNLDSYAGSWFDSVTGRLHVAISNRVDSLAIQRFGAIPVIVATTLAELEETRKNVLAIIEDDSMTAGSIRESYVDVESNRVVIDVRSGNIGQVAALLRSFGLDIRSMQLREVANDVDFSTGNVRGADGTQNLTWAQDYGGAHPCSIGASVVGGFATAGHCGSLHDAIGTPTGSALGEVLGSTFHISTHTFDNYEDGAWVATGAGWTPTPQVNGYSDGTLYVDGEWAGTLEAPVGATVCRYGQTSGGPHCAPLTARNVNVYFGTSLIKGLVEVDGVCTEDGDSGGTVITPAGQMQGTNTGGLTLPCSHSPASDFVEYFQPIETTLSRFSSTMLTTHGNNSPTISGFLCPNPGDSGSEQYACLFDSFDSQGETPISWTTNTGDSSNQTYLFGTCNRGQTVTVNLAVSNPYGVAHKSKSFACPTKPLP